jgi:DNA polymerase-3 subunit gamma/tau
MTEIAGMAEHAPDFTGLLRDVVMLLHRLAVIQQVPDIDQQAWGHDIGLTELAAAVPPEVVQLYYQIALNGQRDISLAPDERSGFEMVMLRMLAFRPSTTEPQGGMDATALASKPYPIAQPPSRPASGVAEPTSGERVDPPAAMQASVPETDPDSHPESGLEPGDWSGLVRRLGLKGMAAQLAENCVMDNWDGRSFGLLVDPGCSSLIGTLAEQRLQESLSQAMGKDVMLSLTVRAVAEETPARQEAREQQVRQKETEADIAADPLVLAVQDAFDAEIVTDSIRRIDQPEQ